jgi:hypothetical protein
MLIAAFLDAISMRNVLRELHSLCTSRLKERIQCVSNKQTEVISGEVVRVGD